MPSAGIVYDGVLANRTPDGNNNQNPYEGTLFNGLKFWISQRVPDRKSLLESVKANGGKTVLLEKHADILIADHVFKNAPVGSVSWKYITDSISEGQLADIDLYTIEHATAQGAHPVGSTMPTKSTRTSYTPHDDNILIHWVLQKERSGAYTRGNKIYMELAKKYPQHTWQSWRDRFSKRYDHQHRDTLVKLLPQDYQPPAPAPAPAPPAPPPSHAPAPVYKKENVTPSVKTTTVHMPAPSRPQAQPPSSVPAPAGGRVAFTDEDDQILIRYLKRMNREGESLQGNIIYKEFAKQYPHHSWQSWRNRWVETLQATTTLEEDDPAGPADPDVTEPGLPEPTPRTITRPEVKATPQSADQAAAKRRLTAALNRARQDVPTKSSPMGPVKATVTSSAHKKSSPRRTPSRLEEISKRARLVHEEKKKIKSASVIQRAWRSYQARKQIPWRQSLIQFQALAKGSLLRRACAPAFEESQSRQLHEEAEVDSNDAGSVDLGQSPEDGISGTTQTTREQFYEYFSKYNEGLGTNPVPWVTIGGKAVDMWDLWTAITKQEVPAHARDWQEIAELLALDWIAEPDVPNQLQAAFQEHLAEFENYYKEYQEADLDKLIQGTDQDSEEGEEGEEADNDQIEAEEEEVDADGAENTTLPQDPNTTEFRSSPPIIGALKFSGGLKRNLDQIISSPLASMTRKRLRYDVEDEVPESPPKRWQSPLPPILEVTSWPEEAADVAPVDDEEYHDDAADDMPIFGDDEDDYGVEDHRDDNEDVFTTPLQQPRQTTVERALSLRPSSASKSQKFTSAQKKSTTQPSSKSQAQYISSDSDSDSSSDAFATPLNPPRPPPERRRSPIPDPIPRPSAAPAARRQLPPRDTAPASRSPPPRFRIPPPPPDPFVSDDEGNQRCVRPRQPPSQPQPPRPSAAARSSAARSSLPPVHRQQPQHQKQHRQSTAAPQAVPPHARRDFGNGIASEDPLAIINRYLALGYKKRHCKRGVLATTHDPNVAGRAIDLLAKGHRLPNNVPGIWTASDDEGLKGMDRARERGQDMDEDGRNVREVEGRLLEKHGRKRMELRRNFLRCWDMV